MYKGASLLESWTASTAALDSHSFTAPTLYSTSQHPTTTPITMTVSNMSFRDAIEVSTRVAFPALSNLIGD